MKIFVNGLEKHTEGTWKDIRAEIQGSALSDLLETNSNVFVAPELEQAFDCLLHILLSSTRQQNLQAFLHNSDLLDRVMVLATHFQLEEIAETIADALLEQEEERASRCQCLKCGMDHPSFCHVTSEMCDRCTEEEACRRRQCEYDESSLESLPVYSCLGVDQFNGLAVGRAQTLDQERSLALGLGGSIEL